MMRYGVAGVWNVPMIIIVFYYVLSPVHYFYRYYHDRSECSIVSTRKGAGDHDQSNGQ